MPLPTDMASVPWRATHQPGVFWHPLEDAGGAGEPSKDSVVLIRMEPGCGYPAHRHIGIEDVFVLQGGYRDDLGEHLSGTYIRYAAGTVHAPVALGDPGRAASDGNPSCILFAIARDGVQNL